MSVHYSLEALSSYIDAELTAGERKAVREHVLECPECRERLAGLESVVGNLQRLETVSAPSTLGLHVERRARLESHRLSFSSRLEEGLYRVARQPVFAPLFALVMAFGVILYLFSLGVANQSSSDTRIVIGRVSGESERGLQEATADSVGGLQEETGFEARTEVEDRSERALEGSETVTVAGRRFSHHEGIWWEDGTESLSPDTRIDVSGGDSLPEGLEELLWRGGTFRIFMDGRLVEIVVPEPSD